MGSMPWKKKYEGTPEYLEYPQMCARRVSPSGVVNIEGRPLFLSRSLARWSVGLKPMAEDLMEVWFGRLLLGQIDLATSNFIRTDIRPNKTANETEKV